MRVCRPLFVFLLASFILAETTHAQPTHIERLQKAGIECLQDVVSGVVSMQLDADERAPYLRAAMIEAWKKEGRTLFVPDSVGVRPEIPAFNYRVDDVRVELERLKAGQVARTAVVSLQYSLIAPNGQILSNNLCTGQQQDTIRVELVDHLSDARFPETSPQDLGPGLFTRIVEPAVIIGAAVIGTYLFFNLRSKRTEGG